MIAEAEVVQPWEPAAVGVTVQQIKEGDQFVQRLVMTALATPPDERARLVEGIGAGEPDVLADLKKRLRVREVAAVRTLDEEWRQSLTGGLHRAESLAPEQISAVQAIFRFSGPSLNAIMGAIAIDFRTLATARQANGH